MGKGRRLAVIQFTLRSHQAESIFCVGQAAGADLAYALQIHLNGDLYLCIQQICTVFQLCSHAVSLPLVPIGDMGILGISLAGGELSIFIHGPPLAAGMTG